MDAPQNCPFCDKKFIPRSNLIPNMPRGISISADLDYECSSCFKDYREAGPEARHIYEEEMRQQKKQNEEELARKISEAKSSGDWSSIPYKEIVLQTAHIVVTSSYVVAGAEIDHEIEFISAECVYGMNIFRDFFAGLTDIFGGRSVATQKVLRDARRVAIAELRREALMVGADAVIAVDLDYQELSGGGKSGMLMIVATGTAVALKKLPSDKSHTQRG